MVMVAEMLVCGCIDGTVRAFGNFQKKDLWHIPAGETGCVLAMVLAPGLMPTSGIHSSDKRKA